MKFILFFGLTIMSSSIFAQTAYKDYEWGMTVEQVKNVSSDLILYKNSDRAKNWYGNNVPTDVYNGDFNVLGVYLKCIIDDRIYIPKTEPSINDIYYSETAALRFYFVEGKLRFIKLVDPSKLKESDFISKYGKPYIQEWKSGGDTKATSILQDLFVNEGNRFILLVINKWWYPKDSSGMYSEWDKILYLDRKWFTDTFTNWFANYKTESQRSVNKILD